MKKMHRFAKAALATFMAASMMAGSGILPVNAEEGGLVPARETPAGSMTLTVANSTFSVAPFSMPSPGFNPQAYMMYARLFYQSSPTATIDNGGMQPWIGKTVTKVDDLTYDVELFDNVHDSQGNPIKADDVIFSYEMSATEGEFSDYTTTVESMTKIDDYNVEIKFKIVMPGTVESILGNDMLCIVSKDWYENTPEAERQSNPATTGAYTVEDAMQGSGFTLVRNEDPWQSEPTCTPQIANVDKIYCKLISEPSMRTIALENHEVDCAIVASTDLAKFYDEAAGEPLEGWNLNFGPKIFENGIFCNMDSAESIMADNIELRKAVLLALDGEDLMYAGGHSDVNAEVAYALSAPDFNGYEEIRDESYAVSDLDEARAHFEAAGVEEGTEITLLSSQSLYTDAVRSVVIAQLEAVGFSVNSLAVDQALFNTYKNDSTQWDIMIDARSSSTSHVVGMWDSMFNPESYTNGSMCFTHDDELVALLNAAKSDPSTENLKAFNAYVTDNAICKMLYGYSNLYATQAGIEYIPFCQNEPVYGSSTIADDYEGIAD